MSAAHDYEDPYEAQQRLIAEMNADHVAAMRAMDAEDAEDQAAYQRVADDNAEMDRLIAEMSDDNAGASDENDGDTDGEPAQSSRVPRPRLTLGSVRVGRGGFRYV